MLMKKDFYSFEQWCKDNKHEDWLDLWDYELNGKSPSEVTYKSGKKCWFKCPRGLHGSEIKNLHNITSGKAKLFCKKCRSFGQYLLDEFGENGVNTYWSNKNNFSPFEICRGSKTKVWIKCAKDKTHPDYLTSAFLFSSGCRCPICGYNKLCQGVNDVYTTHPDVIKYFVNPEDAKTVTKSSEKIVDVVCPDCGHIMKKRVCDIVYLNCPKCGDGSSYPNKYVYEFLIQLKDVYHFNIYPEHVFDWSSNLGINNKYRKIYDFYIEYNNEKIIIEVQGYQHYTGSFYKYGHDVNYEINNDITKRELAIKNGILESNYIYIDAKKSNSDWIKKSILQCNLSSIFNFEEQDINWTRCNQIACKSLVKTVSELWNNGIKSTAKIADIIGKRKGTVIDYLKRAAEIGLCKYNPQDSHKIRTKPIKCLDNNYAFSSINVCSKMSDIIFGRHLIEGSICQVANGISGSIYDLHFTYITKEDFLQLKDTFPNCVFGDIY